MLDSIGKFSHTATSADLGSVGSLVKPVRKKELGEMLQTALLGLKIASEERYKPHENSNAAQGTNHGQSEHALAEWKPRILLVEDNLVNRRLATALLEKLNYSVLTAEHGQAALSALAATTVDAVLMDVQMPVMDGLEATAAIRHKERGTGRHLPIVALTAHAMKGDRELCIAAGMDDYLTKPVRSSELRETLKSVLEKWPAEVFVDVSR